MHCAFYVIAKCGKVIAIQIEMRLISYSEFSHEIRASHNSNEGRQVQQLLCHALVVVT